MDRAQSGTSSSGASQEAPAVGEFFLLNSEMSGGPAHGVVFENKKSLLAPPRLILRPEAGGFPHLEDVPRLVFDPRKGVPPKDMEPGFSGYWLVSERLKNVFEVVDPSAFEFVEADYRLEDGSQGPRYFLCDVVRVVDALDEERSKLTIEVSDDYAEGRFYDLAGGASLAFRKDALGDAHVFRLPFSGDLIFCDRELVDAVADAGISVDRQSDGIWFQDATDI